MKMTMAQPLRTYCMAEFMPIFFIKASREATPTKQVLVLLCEIPQQQFVQVFKSLCFLVITPPQHLCKVLIQAAKFYFELGLLAFQFKGVSSTVVKAVLTKSYPQQLTNLLMEFSLVVQSIFWSIICCPSKLNKAAHYLASNALSLE